MIKFKPLSNTQHIPSNILRHSKRLFPYPLIKSMSNSKYSSFVSVHGNNYPNLLFDNSNQVVNKFLYVFNFVEPLISTLLPDNIQQNLQNTGSGLNLLISSHIARAR